ncbi:MAG TPA: hypothetical protein DCS09_14475 [Porphyromonadaceae bacterium]|nr:hypothetical protein [Porphyromonadaceae bacterium]
MFLSVHCHVPIFQIHRTKDKRFRFILIVLQGRYFRMRILQKMSETVFEAVKAILRSLNIIRLDNIQSFDIHFSEL